MSRLDDLISQYCPDGVSFHSLKEICTEIIVPMRDRPKDLTGPIPWCRIEDKEGQYFNGSLSGLGVTEETIKQMNLKVFPTGTVICSCSASIGAYAINTKPIITNQTFIGLVCGDNLFNRFLLYYMETQTAYLLSQASTGTIPYISRKKFENMLIPVPPLSVQQEIVRILDSFSNFIIDLQGNLQTELQKRKIQYNSYASKLFLDNCSERFPMGQLAKFVYGYTDTAKESGTARFIRITDIDEQGYLKKTDAKYIDLNDNSSNSLVSPGDLLMARTGATYGKTLYFEEDYPCVYASFLIKIIPDNEQLLNKYYWYFTKTSLYWEQAEKLVTTGGQPQFNTPAIKQVSIPLCSIDKQKRIIEILDRMEDSFFQLSISITTEIEARQKQYEYYRDKLLSFKEKKTLTV